MAQVCKYLMVCVVIVLLAGACQPIVAPEGQVSAEVAGQGEYAHPEMLVDTAWLAEHLSDPNVRILDTRDFLAEGDAANRLASYEAGHIPGAVYVESIADISDPNADVPLMMLPADEFEALMGRLGISNDTTVVAYDDSGDTLAARLWWALRYYGHDDVKLLDGGLTQWILEDRPLETGSNQPPPAVFQAEVQPGLLATKADVLAAIEDPDVVLIDGLWPEHFLGEGDTPEDRVGHIPTAINVYAMDNLDPTNHTLLPAESLAELWQKAELTPGQPIITYCGAGYYGAFNLFVLNQLGYENVRLYDGSWLEWAADPSLPVEVGAAKTS
jgi:thiosulfate/3-mercaptopyruvate sulfurtransferase